MVRSIVVDKYIKPFAPGLALSSLFTAGIALTFIYIGYLVKQFVDGSSNLNIDNDIFIYISIAIVTLSGFIFGRMYVANYTGERIICKIKTDIFHKMIHQTQTFFECKKVSEITSSVATETTILQNFISNNLSVALRSTIILIGSLIMIINTSPSLTLYVILILLSFIALFSMVARKSKKLSKESLKNISETNCYLDEILKNVRIIQSFVFEKIEYDRFSQSVLNDHKITKRYILVKALLVTLVIFSTLSSINMILWIVHNDQLSQPITAGDLSSFIFYSILIAGSINNITDIYGNIQRAMNSIDILSDLLKEIDNMKYVLPLADVNTITKGNIEIKNLCFSYPSTPNTETLSDLTLSIKSCETLAIVGHSGVGKSTILSALMRFYDYQSGSIEIDGIDIRSIEICKLRSIFGSVEQEPVIFSTTVRNNLLYGNPNATDNEIIEAIKAAHAHNFIMNMPNKLDTFVGEKGTRLSVGQKQRIAIARIILQKPKILLLDEATSSLDAENESLIQETLAKIMKNCTSIVIAHRLSTIVNADRIALIEDGKIKEIGTHKELMKKGNSYAKLSELQTLA